jgi:oxalate decarboxylase/phosphoglucose isomerase-like protein (cupin superfamily)
MTTPHERTGFIDRMALPTDQLDWGVIKWLVTPDKDSGAQLTLGEVAILPGLGHERHNHPLAEEVLYVLSGIGLQMVADGEPYPVQAGDVIYIPKAVYHSTMNTGWETLRMIALYNPGGSELDLHGLPDFRQLAPGESPKIG